MEFEEEKLNYYYRCLSVNTRTNLSVWKMIGLRRTH